MQTEDPAPDSQDDLPSSPERPAGKPPVRTPVVVGLIAGAMLATAFVVAIVRQNQPGLQPSLGGEAPANPAMEVPGESITLVSPAGNTPQGELRMSWKSSENYSSYQAVIINTVGRVLWRSKPGTETDAKVPSRVLKNIVSGKTYLWYVIGTREDGSTLQTSSAIFIISK